MPDERPILFSAPMVRAILDGRKTQTRRVAKLRRPAIAVEGPDDDGDGVGVWLVDFDASAPMPDHDHVYCPYGQRGDRLWVRETFGTVHGNGVRAVYAADGIPTETLTGERIEGMKWQPSIFMPRSISRITLEITSVRIERLTAITPEDAEAEGLAMLTKDGGRLWKYGIPDADGLPGEDDDGWPWHLWRISPVDAYEALWDSLNAKRGFGWTVNPLVWVIEFRKVGDTR